MLRRPRTEKHNEPSGPYRLLVVDDQPDAARLVSTLLRRAGFEVAEVGDHALAIATLVNEPEPISAVVASFTGAGGSSSLKLLEAVRNHRDPRVHRVKVIVVLDSARQQLYTWQSGADGVLARPYPATSLIECVADSVSRPDSERAAHRAAMAAAFANDDESDVAVGVTFSR